MKNKTVYLIAVTSIMTALVCIMTMVVRIPTPTKGYLNLGDCFVLLSGYLLGPVFGFFAGGVGSALADLFAGYPLYIPGTLIIKGTMSLIVALSLRSKSDSKGVKTIKSILGLVIAEIIMIAGYYLYEAVIIGEGFEAAFAGVGGNAVQGAFGAVIAFILIKTLQATKIIKKYDDIKKGSNNGDK